jgi:molecular chaperone DnaK
MTAPPPVPAPPVPPRSRWWLPLAASSCLLVLLVVAIVVVAADKAGRRRTPGTAGPSASAVIDPCLVGTWDSTSDRQTIPVAGYGPVTVTGQGAVVRIGRDGSDVQDYGSSTPYTASPPGHQLKITVTGTVRGTIRTSGNTMTFQDMSASGTLTATVDGGVVATVPLSPGTDPVTYTCSGDTLNEQGQQQFEVTLKRRASP